MAKRSVRTIEEKAGAILRKHDVTDPPVRVRQLARTLGAVVREVDGDAELSGMLFREGDTLVIGVNTMHHKNRQRFTVAHEIGHLVLHRSSVYLDTVHRRDTRAALGTDDEEIEANQFAAALLMPAHFLRRDLSGGRFTISDLHTDDKTISDLARRYQVSPQALTLRLENLKLLPSLGL